MELSLDRFYVINRRVLTWLLLFALIWLLRDFFGLVFLVFFFSFVSAALAGVLRRFLRLPHAAAIVAVYLLFLAVLGGFVRYIVPQVIRETEHVVANLGELEATLAEYKGQLAKRYPGLDGLITAHAKDHLGEEDRATFEVEFAGPLPGAAAPPDWERRRDRTLLELYLRAEMGRLQARLPELVKLLWQASGTTVLALFFSFLISLDTVRLKRGVASLRRSRMRDFYEQTGQPVVRFGTVVGRAVQAQAMIACLNTLLTTVGFWLLGIPSLAPLALLVFLCSFIPVLGVFLSTAPAVLLALNGGGLPAALAVVAMVIGVHAVEAYLLNPLIYGRHMKLNPALVLIILYVGHHAFGVWGLILAVPVAYYLLHDVLGLPILGSEPEEEAPAPAGPAP